jgi:riboflavin biosynthesis pyrimidine reductase
MKIINVMAASVDGATALSPGESDEARRVNRFSNDDDYKHLLEMISNADAVIVGRETVAASGPIDTKRTDGSYPDWYIYTNSGFPAGHSVFSSPVPLTFVSRSILPAHHYKNGAGQFFYGENPPAGALVENLKKTGKKSVLLLGGGALNQLFYKEGLVDELYLTVCPVIAGSTQAVNLVRPPLPRPVPLVLKSSKVMGNLVFLKYKIQNQSI